MTPSKPCLDEPFVMCRRPLLNSGLPSSPSSGALQAPPCLERRRYAPFPFSNPPPLARPCCLLATASAGCSSPPPFLPSSLSRRRRRLRMRRAGATAGLRMRRAGAAAGRPRSRWETAPAATGALQRGLELAAQHRVHHVPPASTRRGGGRRRAVLIRNSGLQLSSRSASSSGAPFLNSLGYPLGAES